jgi:2'-5' RNA ligase
VPETQRQRLFFALWPDASIREGIGAVRRNALGGVGRPIRPENLHLTLVFLGEVEPEGRMCAEAAAAAVRAPAFELRLDDLGWFRRSQIAWLGAAHLPRALEDLVNGLHDGLSHCGFPREERPFKAHVTLARKVRSAPSVVDFAPVPWLVQGFALVESIAQPQGVRYAPLAHWPLLPEG